MPLPDITHLQFLVLDIVVGTPKTGQEIRDRLSREGCRKSGPAFYQMMARLEDAGLVEGWYEQKNIDGHCFVKERIYKLTDDGLKEYLKTREFYADHIPYLNIGEEE